MNNEDFQNLTIEKLNIINKNIIELNNTISELNSTLCTIESITAKNWIDIIRLKRNE